MRNARRMFAAVSLLASSLLVVGPAAADEIVRPGQAPAPSSNTSGGSTNTSGGTTTTTSTGAPGTPIGSGGAGAQNPGTTPGAQSNGSFTPGQNGAPSGPFAGNPSQAPAGNGMGPFNQNGKQAPQGIMGWVYKAMYAIGIIWMFQGIGRWLGGIFHGGNSAQTTATSAVQPTGVAAAIPTGNNVSRSAPTTSGSPNAPTMTPATESQPITVTPSGRVIYSDETTIRRGNARGGAVMVPR